MKTIIQLLTICLCIKAYGQVNLNAPPNLQKQTAEWLAYDKAAQKSAAQLMQDKTALQLSADDDLELLTTQNTSATSKHYRYQQSYKGIPIEGAIYLLHEKDALVHHANGRLVRALNLNTNPTIDETTALQAALAEVEGERYAWQEMPYEARIKAQKKSPSATYYPKGKLLIFNPDFDGQAADYRLAYQFDVYSLRPLSRQKVYIDASTGDVLAATEQIHQCNEVPATGAGNHAGAVSFLACYDNGLYILKNNSGGGIQVFNSNSTNNHTFQNSIADTDNFFGNQQAATDVFWASQKTYEYYLTTFGRNSIDDANMPVHSWVNFVNNYGGSSNAYWLVDGMAFGNGDGTNYNSFTSLDIVAHEYTHGVTQFAAGLYGTQESGALNESFSDIFGEVIENAVRGSNDWITGAEIVALPGKNGFRNLSNPKDTLMITTQPDTYLGENWYTGLGDNGGVHYNSGIQNHWFYLLSEGGTGTNDNGDFYTINGIGINNAAAIAYLNLTAYLTPDAQFTDAAAGAIQAAEELFGSNSNEATQAAAAWCAVGVCTTTPVNPCRYRDSLALVALYESTNGLTWNLNQPIHSWSGILLTPEGCVDRIELLSQGLSGTIPPEIGNLADLTFLSFYDNALTGNIPPEIGQLTNLTDLLDFSYNNLTGTVPIEIGQLTALRQLKAYANNLSGNIPVEVGNMTNLEHFDLSGNALTGNIPPDIGNLPLLNYLSLRYNQLTGTIPAEIDGLQNLYICYLNDNQFNFSGLEILMDNNINTFHYASQAPILLHRYGDNLYTDAGGTMMLNTYTWYRDGVQISTTTGNKDLVITTPGMYRCVVENSSITNPADPNQNLILYSEEKYINPTAGLTCRERDSLTLIALYNATGGTNWDTSPYDGWDFNNPINWWYGITLNASGCVAEIELSQINMTGYIPAEIGELSELTYLSFYNNNLTGNIPTEIGNLSNLRELHLAENNLTGNIPVSFGYLSNLERLYLNTNALIGNVPTGLGNLTNLTELQICCNALTGTLPTSLGNLTNLQYFFINDNGFTGEIPTSYGNLSDVSQIDFSSNELSGAIPTSLSNLNNLTYLNLASNQLSGNIPTGLSSMKNLSSVYLSYNNFTYDGLEILVGAGISDLKYAPQAAIPIWSNNYTLSVDAGGTMSNNTYHWYKEDVLIYTAVGDNTFTPLESGAYECDVTNALVTNQGSTKTNLILTGTSTYISLPLWPGDFNNDGIANAMDALYWGLANGNVGPIRTSATNNWTPQNGLAWQTNVNGINGRYQDGTGDGVIDNDDLAVLNQNYGNIHTITGSSPTSDNGVKIRLEVLSFQNNSANIAVYLETTNFSPISVHGIAFSLFPIAGTISAATSVIDTTNSWLEPDAMLIQDNQENGIDVAITRTDGNDRTGIQAPIVELVIDIDLPTAEPSSGLIISEGNFVNAEGAITALPNFTSYNFLPEGGGNIPLNFTIEVSHAQCNVAGEANIEILSGLAPYTYGWNTGQNTAQLSNLSPGIYAVTVTDAGGESGVLAISIEGLSAIETTLDYGVNGEITANPLGGTPPYTYRWNGQSGNATANLTPGLHLLEIIDATGCQLIQLVSIADLNISVFLEGAYDTNTGLMRDDLRSLNLLPQTDPYTNTLTATPGTFSVSGNDAIVDWVLLELRDINEPDKILFSRPALLQRDGDLTDIDGTSLPRLVLAGATTAFLIIKHRSHLPAMSPQMLDLNNALPDIDFTINNSLIGTGSGVGQKEMMPGVWALFSGDMDESKDINGGDKALWSAENGSFNVYLNTDLNMDGESSGSDKILWIGNNGIFSGTPGQ